MAGKKGMTGSGGIRPGGGRPPKEKPDYEDEFKDAVLMAAKKLAKKYGKPIEEAVLSLCFESNTQDSVKASIFKVYADMFTVKQSRQSLETKERPLGPTIYKKNDRGELVITKLGGTISGSPGIFLPEIEPDPATVVQRDGKKNAEAD
jgi:hypothetical protein